MTREEVNQTLNKLCQYGGMMLDWRYIEAIRIAAIFYETGEDTATEDTEKEFAESIIALIPHLPTESDKARIQIATKEKSCENCKYKCFREAYSCVETPCNACYETSHFATKEGDGECVMVGTVKVESEEKE